MIGVLSRAVLGDENKEPLRRLEPSSLPTELGSALGAIVRVLDNSPKPSVALLTSVGVPLETIQRLTAPDAALNVRSIEDGVQIVEMAQSRLRAMELLSQAADSLGTLQDSTAALSQISQAVVLVSSQHESPCETLTGWQSAAPSEARANEFLAPEGLTTLYGSGGIGKSLLAEDLLVRLTGAAPEPWLSTFSLGQGSLHVLVLDFETGAKRWRERLRALVEGNGLDRDLAASAELRLKIVPNLGEPSRMVRDGRLRQLIEKHHPNLVCIDPARRILPPGASENEAVAVGAVLDELRALCTEYGIRVLLIDHAGKSDGSLRGSSVKVDAADRVWSLGTGKGASEDWRELGLVKTRDECAVSVVRFAIRRGPGIRFEIDPVARDGKAAMDELSDRILTAIGKASMNGERLRQSDLVKRLSLAKQRISEAVKKLEKAGKLAIDGGELRILEAPHVEERR